jgi:phage N-6-adenine-methyltransferase
MMIVGHYQRTRKIQMSNLKVHFSSDKQTWETPQAFFDMLDAEFHFSLDVCATVWTAKCRRYFTKEDDGLSMEWSGVCWMNPPYGRDIGAWLAKAYQSTISNDATVVCLIPARTDTAWWHDYVMKANEIRLIRGRLKFGGAKNSAPFPSAVVVFRPFSSPMGFEVRTLDPAIERLFETYRND